jgi:hypothetical protein
MRVPDGKGANMADNGLCWMIETHDSLMLPTTRGEKQCYRVRNGNVEFQASPRAHWRRLQPTDVLQHVELKTVVAGWLKRRFWLRNANRDPEYAMR